MYLKRDNLVIRSATLEDANILCKWWNDGEVMAHAGFPNGIGTSKEAVMDKINADNENSRRLVIEIDTSPIGEMSYKKVSEGIAEIGIKICNINQQNKGYGTKAINMLIEYIFGKGYKKIVLDTNLNNIRAQHVYEKIGFKKVVVKINSWKNQLGEYQSSIEYELTCEDFISDINLFTTYN